MKESSAIKCFLLGLMAGGVIGGLTALLYAPKPGRELRNDISKQKDRLIEDANRYISSSKEKASELISEGKKRAETIFEDSKKKFGEIKDKTENLLSSAKEKVLNEASNLKDAVKAGNDAYKKERKTTSEA
jgi:gas vesicle protein